MIDLSFIDEARERVRTFQAKDYHDASDVAELCEWQLWLLDHVETTLKLADDLREHVFIQEDTIRELTAAIRDLTRSAELLQRAILCEPHPN